MKLFVSFLLVASVSAFVPVQQRTHVGRPLAMSDDQGGKLVPVKEETVEFTAGLLGGVAGLLVGGPLFGAIAAAAANYVSKKEGDAPTAVQAVSKSSIEIFNYLANLDKKYEVLEKTKTSLQESIDKLKANGQVDPEIISKAENTLKNTNEKIKELNDEYDLVGGATTALGVVGDLVEKAIKKAGELNAEYNLSEKAKDSLAKAVDKAKEASSTAVDKAKDVAKDVV